jgi:hypothetical protein
MAFSIYSRCLQISLRTLRLKATLYPSQEPHSQEESLKPQETKRFAEQRDFGLTFDQRVMARTLAVLCFFLLLAEARSHTVHNVPWPWRCFARIPKFGLKNFCVTQVLAAVAHMLAQALIFTNSMPANEK